MAISTKMAQIQVTKNPIKMCKNSFWQVVWKIREFCRLKSVITSIASLKKKIRDLVTMKNWTFTASLCLKITEKVSFNTASEASYVYILSGQKLIKNAKNGPYTQNVAFEFLNFDLLKLTCLVTLFDRKLQVFKNSPKWTTFWPFS